MKSSSHNRIYLRFPYRELAGSSRPSARSNVGNRYIAALSRELKARLQEPDWSDLPFSSISIGGASGWLSVPGLIDRVFEMVLSQIPLVEDGCYAVLRCDVQDFNDDVLTALEAWKGVHLFLRATTSSSHLRNDMSPPLSSTGILSCCRTVSDQRIESYGVVVSTGHKVQSPLSFRDDIRTLLDLRPPVIKTRAPRTKNQFIPLTMAFQSSSQVKEQQKGQRVRRRRYRQAFNEALSCAGYQSARPDLFTLGTSNFPLFPAPKNVMGIGVGAVSVCRRGLSNGDLASRSINSHDTADYIRDWEQNRDQLPESSIQLDLIDQYHQHLLNSFSKGDPLELKDIEDRFGVPIPSVHPGLIEILVETGFVERKGGSIVLTERGRMQADKVTKNFFIREEDLEYLSRPLNSSSGASTNISSRKSP